MSHRLAATILSEIELLLVTQATGRLSDRELLQRFVLSHDEAAFTALLERYGAMVMRVCRHRLSDFHAAEDAFQATFLVLAQKAGSIRQSGTLASWLHSVACRTAVPRRTDPLPKEIVRNVADPSPGPLTEIALREARSVLDEELQRLPEKYRCPLILCCLEERTRDEAARQLGWPEGTFKKRLEKARELLRQRLTRRGLTLSGGLVAMLLSGDTVAVGAALKQTTLQSSLLAAAGKPLDGVVTVAVARLSKGVLYTMTTSKPKLAMVLMLVLAVGAGAGVLYVQAVGGPPAANVLPGPGEKPPAKDRPAEGDLIGSWLAISIEKDGKATAADEFNGSKLAITNSAVFLSAVMSARDGRFSGIEFSESDYKHNSIAKPPTIDLQPSGSPDKRLGIYSLEGNQLKLCIAEPGTARPEQFQTRQGQQAWLIVYRRVPAEKARELKTLLKEKLDVAKDEWRDRRKEFEAGRGTLSFLHGAALRLRETHLEMSTSKEDRLAVLEAHLERLKEVHSVQKARFDGGRIPTQDLSLSKYYLLEAEIILARARNADK